MRIYPATLLSFAVVMVTHSVLAKSLYHAERWITPEGARVIFHQAMEVPMLDVTVGFAAGSAYDGKQFGLSTLTTQLLESGSQGLDADTIADKFADVGAQYEADVNQDIAMLRLRTLAEPKTRKPALETFSLVMNHPDFPEEAFKREKSRLLMAIKLSQETPKHIADQAFYHTLYQDHPYGHSPLGEINTVSPMTPADVRAFYKKYFVNRNAFIVIVGAISSSEAHQIAATLSKDMPSGETAPALPMATPLKEAIQKSISYPASQTLLRIGQLGITHQVPDYHALQLGNYILGAPGSLVSRLAYELRENRGLTYSVHSQFTPMPGVGPFIIDAATRNEAAQTSVHVTKSTLSSFVKNGPSKQDVEAAQKHIRGSFPLLLAKNSDLSIMLLKIAFYHLPDDFLDTYVERMQALTAEDIHTAFEKHIDPNKLIEVSVGQAT